MGGPLRGKQGCWTCRLRRKKCDERRPQCSTCESLSITCYGFGPKPDWMDNGEKEKAVVNELKEIVKHTWRRKAPSPSSRSRQDVAKIAPKSSINMKKNSSTASESTPRLDFTPPSDHGSSSSALHDPRVPETLFSIPPDESLLLMHFLDKVFPLQYPMYDPNTMDGGRGWLLSSLLQSKSFYHAALASSTYHRRTTNSEKMSRQQQVTALVQQEKYLEISIRLVNESAQQLCPTSRLGIIASVVQLIFLEVPAYLYQRSNIIVTDNFSSFLPEMTMHGKHIAEQHPAFSRGDTSKILMRSGYLQSPGGFYMKVSLSNNVNLLF